MDQGDSMEKRKERERIRQLAKTFSEADRALMDKKLLENLENHIWFQQADCVYAYAPLETEAGGRNLPGFILASGKKLALPRVEGEQIVFCFVESEDQLEKGAFGIREPAQECLKAGDAEALMLVPGAAFTPEGIRLGKGGGFYDRFLQKEPCHRTLGLAYGYQIVPQLEETVHDRRVMEVITPERIWTAESARLQFSGSQEIQKQKKQKERDQNMLEEIGRKAKEASFLLGKMGTGEKNRGLLAAADAILSGQEEILKANGRDVERARKRGMAPGLVDRLLLTPERIQGIVEGMRQVADLEDPVGEVLSMKKRPNGLVIGQKRVPLGVVGIIYEARPNVTADAFALCFKTGNASILRGGSDALESNTAITDCIRSGLVSCGITEDAVQLITDTDHETAREFMQMREYLDVLIPRGGAGLIRSVVENSKVPVIETGTGNCHIYVDETADFQMALDIIFNAKTQRIGVCNACESTLVHRKIAGEFLPLLKKRLDEKQVEIRADEAARAIVPEFTPATEEDWGTEYLDYILSCKLVDSVDEAIAHINRYNTGHSEAIITESYENARKFLDEVDAAAVYVNASTRFTDGFEFGFGAEIGISTQKLHARGPMGLTALTSTKYVIYGDGQIRK